MLISLCFPLKKLKLCIHFYNLQSEFTPSEFWFIKTQVLRKLYKPSTRSWILTKPKVHTTELPESDLRKYQVSKYLSLKVGTSHILIQNQTKYFPKI